MAEAPWRLALRNLGPDERRELAELLKVDDTTVLRWGLGQATPRKPEAIRNLAKYMPKLETLLREEFPAAFDTTVDEGVQLQMPADHPMTILSLYSRVAKNMLNPTLQTYVYEYMASQLDPYRDGIVFLFAQCVAPPEHEPVIALEIKPGYGTKQWSVHQIEKPFLLGKGTLCGVAVSTGRPAFYPHDQAFRKFAPVVQVDRLKSVGVFPVTRCGEIAGGLFCGSVVENFFSPPRKKLIKEYAELFALSLRDEQFYPQERIALTTVPTPEHQKVLLQDFYELMEECSLASEQELSLDELEEQAMQVVRQLKQDCKSKKGSGDDRKDQR
jgi:hypothetical protein